MKDNPLARHFSFIRVSKYLAQFFIGYLSNCKLLAVTKFFQYFLCISLGPGSALWEKGEKIGVGENKKSTLEASREVVWGGERVAEPGYMSLMPPIRPPATNLSLKCQHVKFSSRMSAWANYAAFVKKYLSSRWSNSASKEI